MYQQLSPTDFVVKEPFRWRGVLLAESSGLPNDMPQGVIRSFVRKGLICQRNGKSVQASAQTTKKAASRKKKKTSKKRARARR